MGWINFLHKLFPFKSLVLLDENALTAYWVLITFVVFIIFSLKIERLANNLKKQLQQCLEAISNPNATDDLIEKVFKGNFLLGPAWKDYSATFIPWQYKEDRNKRKKTEDPSYNYFSEKNLFAINTNVKLLNSIPSILVGLGILGTFVGLAYGISNFKTSSTAEIKNSIAILLSGMGTAFVTSIWGMFLSLVFTFIEKLRINSLHNSIHQICSGLDRKYKLTKQDENDLYMHRQRVNFSNALTNVISEYFIYKDENGNQVKPANVMRDIYQESTKQSKALQAFSTDLAVKIDAGFERLLRLQNELNTIPILEKLQRGISEIANNLKGNATEMSKNVADALEKFKDTVSSSAKSEMERLANLLANAGESLNKLPVVLEETTRRMSELVNQISVNVKKEVEGLQAGQGALITKQTENLQMSDTLLAAFNTSIDKLKGLSDGVEQAVSKFSEVSGEFNSAAGQIRAISENVMSSTEVFKKSQQGFVEHSDKFLAENSKTIEEIQKTLNQAKELSNGYVQKFQIIEKGLQKIFEQIQEGLSGYQNTMAEGIKKYLDKYTDELTKTAQSLAGASEMQKDILEELTEQLDKFNSKRN